MTRRLICFDTEEKILEAFNEKTEPVLQAGGVDSGLPPPFLVATGQSGHAVVGIDVGTRFSRIATLESNQLVQLSPAPVWSQACLLSSGNLTVGIPPSAETVEVVENFRELMGSDWYIEAESGFYGAQELTELLIRRLMVLGQATAERPISKAVLTVPVTYTSKQRKCLRMAAEAAGLDVLQLINEPTAAAFAYLFEDPGFNGNLLVYHRRAGNFAVSVMECNNGLIEVKSTIGDDSLSSNACVDALVRWLVEEFNDQSGYILDEHPALMKRLWTAAHAAIEDLHLSGRAHIKVTNLDIVRNKFPGAGSKTHAYLMTEITKNEYYKLIEPIIVKSFEVVEQAVEEAQAGNREIDRIFIAGDNRRMYNYWDRLYKRFPGATIIPSADYCYPVNGAALQAALLSQQIRDFVIWDIVTEPVWINSNGELKKVISRGTPLPITAYHKCESPDATVNMQVAQGSENLPAIVSLAEIVINNCPPTTLGETKVEVQFTASIDGIIDYKAKHIGLEAPLPLTVIEGDPINSTRAWLEKKQQRGYSEERLNRLARKMGMTPLTVLNVLRSQGYTIESIKNGRAIEELLYKLKRA